MTASPAKWDPLRAAAAGEAAVGAGQRRAAGDRRAADRRAVGVAAGDRATATGPVGWIDLAIPRPAARGAGVFGACGLVPRAILSSFLHRTVRWYQRKITGS